MDDRSIPPASSVDYFVHNAGIELVSADRHKGSSWWLRFLGPHAELTLFMDDDALRRLRDALKE